MGTRDGGRSQVWRKGEASGLLWGAAEGRAGQLGAATGGMGDYPGTEVAGTICTAPQLAPLGGSCEEANCILV